MGKLWKLPCAGVDWPDNIERSFKSPRFSIIVGRCVFSFLPMSIPYGPSFLYGRIVYLGWRFYVINATTSLPAKRTLQQAFRLVVAAEPIELSLAGETDARRGPGTWLVTIRPLLCLRLAL
jgi:hypothetical protein